jgi:hypothetical protein
MKIYGGVEMELSGQFHSWPLYPWGRSPQYPLDRRLGGPHGWSVRYGKKKISRPFWESNPGLQPIARRYTELYRISSSWCSS